MPVVTGPTPLGTPAPDFTLPDLEGVEHKLSEYVDGAAATVVGFLCNHCPYVKHVEDELGRIAAEYAERGVRFVGICSNDVVNYPDDDVPGLKDQVARANWTFDYLVDTSQEIAKAYDAACTPDFFVYDADGTLAYRGAMDESSPGNDQPHDGSALRGALDAILAGESVPLPHLPSMGCGIKWIDAPA